MSTTEVSLINSTVTTKNGKVFANSRDVAEVFGKRHDHTRDAINKLLTEAPACSPNFRETWTDIAMPNGGSRLSKTFDMTKDGFTLLAMGFTGTEALHLKLAYINRFNEMEEALRLPPRSSAFGLNEVREFTFDGHRLRAVATEVGPGSSPPCMAGPEWTTAA